MGNSSSRSFLNSLLLPNYWSWLASWRFSLLNILVLKGRILQRREALYDSLKRSTGTYIITKLRSGWTNSLLCCLSSFWRWLSRYLWRRTSWLCYLRLGFDIYTDTQFVLKFTHAWEIGVCSLMFISFVYSPRFRSASVLTAGSGGEVCRAWGSLMNSLLLSCLVLFGEAWTLNAVSCKTGALVLALRGGASILVTWGVQYPLYVVLVGLPDPFVCLA